MAFDCCRQRESLYNGATPGCQPISRTPGPAPKSLRQHKVDLIWIGGKESEEWAGRDEGGVEGDYNKNMLFGIGFLPPK